MVCRVAAALAPAAEPTAKQQLDTLFADSWEFRLAEDPLFATHVGDHRYNDRLPRETLADQRRRLDANREFLARLEAIPRDELSRGDQVDYDIFRRAKQDAIAEAEFKTYLMPITNRWGFHVEFPELPLNVPLDTVKDYENYLARLEAFDRYVDDHLELMREGVKQGYTLPSVVLSDADEVIEPHIVDDPAQSLLYQPLAKFPESFSESDQKRLREARHRGHRQPRRARLSHAA